MNQVERYFGLLTDNQIRRGVHRSTAELETAIGAYIEATMPIQAVPLDQIG